eukprot:gene27128-2357_t
MGASEMFFDPTELKAVDFVYSLYIAIGILVVRFISEQTLLPKLEAYLESIKAGDKKIALRSFDDFFIAVASLVMEVVALCALILGNCSSPPRSFSAGTPPVASLVVEIVALSALFLGNYGCLPWSTEACFENWPNQVFNNWQRVHYISMFGYYWSELISTSMKKIGVMNFGTILNMEMIIHHFVSMALISLSYISNNLRFGVMWMALFDIRLTLYACCNLHFGVIWMSLFDMSNPLLHFAKTLYPIQRKDYDEAAKKAFAFFALVFFIVRVCAGPYSILYTLSGLFKIASIHYALGMNALAVFVYGLQVVWFYKIFKVATGGAVKKEKAPEKTE